MMVSFKAMIHAGNNDTSVQPQLIAMGAARREPGRGKLPMRMTNHRSPDK